MISAGKADYPGCSKPAASPQEGDIRKRLQFADDRLEAAFMVFQARKSCSTAARAVFLFAGMWLSGVRLAFYHSQVPARLIVVLTIVALMVLYNVCVAALIRWRTRSSLEYLRHEAVKTMVSLVGATMAMVSVLLEEPGEMGLAGAPLPLMTIHAWIVPFYQLRVTTARTLHLFMYLNFLIMLLGRSWLASHYQAQLGPFSWGQVLTGLLTSVVAPLALSSVLEAGCRSAFLRDLRDRTRGQLPPPDLGPTWRRVLPSLGTQQGLMRAALAFW